MSKSSVCDKKNSYLPKWKSTCQIDVERKIVSKKLIPVLYSLYTTNKRHLCINSINENSNSTKKLKTYRHKTFTHHLHHNHHCSHHSCTHHHTHPQRKDRMWMQMVPGTSNFQHAFIHIQRGGLLSILMICGMQASCICHKLAAAIGSNVSIGSDSNRTINRLERVGSDQPTPPVCFEPFHG